MAGYERGPERDGSVKSAVAERKRTEFGADLPFTWCDRTGVGRCRCSTRGPEKCRAVCLSLPQPQYHRPAQNPERLLSGSVQVASGRVRVTVHLVRCDNSAEVWGDTFERSMADVFEVQSEIARNVMVTTVGRMTAEDPWSVTERGTASFKVYQLLHRGLRGLEGHTASEMRDAVESLTRAVALAPRDGRAHGLLAMAMIYDRWYFAFDSTVADVIPIAEKALTLDPRDSRAHCALGVAFLVGREHSRAAHHFEAGLAANPNDDLLLVEYGRFLMYIDRPEDGLRRVREAMRLNPFHPV